MEMTRRFNLILVRLLAVALMSGALFVPSEGRIAAGPVYSSATSSNRMQEQKLTSSIARTGAGFGNSAALSGNTMVIGAPDDDIIGGGNGNQTGAVEAGAAYIYINQGGLWVEQQKLTASDGATDDVFGLSVAIYQDTVVVGALNNDGPAGRDQGAAYIFVRQGGVWSEQQKLTASDATTDDFFSNSVAIHQDTLVIGEISDEGPGGTLQGAAYVFVNQGGVWTEQQKLTASDGGAFDLFSNSVAIYQDTVVVSAVLGDGPAGRDQGAAYIFVRQGGVWSEQQKLTAIDGAAGDVFGNSVAMHQDTMVIGASGDDGVGGPRQGSAYIFMRQGGFWTEQQKLTASDGAAGDFFGNSVAVEGDYLVVGSIGDDLTGGFDQGSVYAFTRPKFDICISDDNSPSVIAWNSQDGRYIICLRGKVYSGQGSVRIKNGTHFLSRKTLAQTIDARFTPALAAGSATLRMVAGQAIVSISDSNTRDSSCNCLTTNQ